MLETKLYIRKSCSLCDEAYDILTRNGFLPELIDIDESPQLKEKFTNCVPVVEIAGKVRFRGKVNEILLRRIRSEAK